MKSRAFRYPGKQEFSPLILFRSWQGQNRGFLRFYILQPIIEKIRLPVSAIRFLNFTPENPGKMLNYARFFGKLNAESMRLEKTAVFVYYARNLCLNPASGAASGSCYRQRVSS